MDEKVTEEKLQTLVDQKVSVDLRVNGVYFVVTAKLKSWKFALYSVHSDKYNGVNFYTKNVDVILVNSKMISLKSY